MNAKDWHSLHKKTSNNKSIKDKDNQLEHKNKNKINIDTKDNKKQKETQLKTIAFHIFVDRVQ
jgi:hypothetical protein